MLVLLWLVICRHVHAQQQRSSRAAEVDTPQGLIDAVDSGAEHVHITEHLDLRNIDGQHDGALIYNPESLMSLTVRPSPYACRTHFDQND